MMLLVLGTGLLGCLGRAPVADAESFVAMQSDFAPYRGWASLSVGPADTGHAPGDRTVYVNAWPEAGATELPVGTMIVKEIAGGETHAMAKRGGGYNAEGAVGWEWFELVLSDDGVPVIQWRGTEAPEGDSYGALPGSPPEDTGDDVTGDCNTCHGAARSNDYVQSFAVGSGGG